MDSLGGSLNLIRAVHLQVKHLTFDLLDLLVELGYLDLALLVLDLDSH